MDTKNYDESTVYDKTMVDTQNVGETPADEKKSHTWQKVVIGGTAGIALGAAASYLSTTKAATSESIESTEEEAETNGNPLVDDTVDMAGGVEEEMSFSQAFATARAEVGPGGAFEWHGGIYSTYLAEEWDNMTPAERDAYNDNFAWNHSGSQSGGNDVAQADSAQSHASQPKSDSVVVEEVDIPNNNDEIADGAVDVEPEIEVLGVVHDPENGMNYGGLVVDGQEAILIDVEGDGTFDIVTADLNGDGQLSEDEIAELEQPITVDDLGGFGTEGSNDIYASDDGPDYINEASGANDFI